MAAPEQNRSQFALAMSFLIIGIGLLFLGMQVEAILVAAALFLLVSFLIMPQTLLWVFLFFHWVMYLPRIGTVVESFHKGLGPVNVWGNDVFFGIVFLLVAVGVVTKTDRLKSIMAFPVAKIALLFIIYQLVQMSWCVISGVNLDSAIREGAKYLACIYIFYVVLYFDRISLEKVCAVFYYLILCLPVAQVIMIATGETWLTSSGTQRTYFIGANMLYLLAIVHHLVGQRVTFRSVLVICYLIAGMAMTQYRSAFLALLTILGLTVLSHYRERKLNRVFFTYLGLFFIMFIGTILLVLTKPDYVQQVATRYADTFNSADRNVQNRAYMWYTSWEAFKQSPVFGVGIGKSIYLNTEKNSWAAQQEWSPHNFAMRLLAKEGIVGLLIVLGLLFIFYRQIRKLPEAAPIQSILKQKLLLNYWWILIINLMNTTFTYKRTSFILWGMIGYVTLLQIEEIRTLENGAPETVPMPT